MLDEAGKYNIAEKDKVKEEKAKNYINIVNNVDFVWAVTDMDRAYQARYKLFPEKSLPPP